MLYARHTDPKNLPQREPDGVWVLGEYARDDGTTAPAVEHATVIISRHTTLEAAVLAGWTTGIQLARLDGTRCLHLGPGEYQRASALNAPRDHLAELRARDALGAVAYPPPMDIQRIIARVAVHAPGTVGDEGDRYATVDVTSDGSANFTATVDLPDGRMIEDLPVEMPLEVHEGLQAAIKRALVNSAEVGVDVTQVR